MPRSGVRGFAGDPGLDSLAATWYETGTSTVAPYCLFAT